MRIKVCVTKKDIESADYNGAGETCPIAMAIKRNYPKIWGDNSYVGQYWAYLFCGAAPIYRSITLPRSAQRAIGKYDRFDDLAPFNFYLEIPED